MAVVSDPMPTDAVGVAAAVAVEVRTLLALIDGQDRRRVYRHHFFMRSACAVSRRCRRLLRPVDAVSDGGVRLFEQESHALPAALVAAGHTASREAACARVDTVGVALSLLAVYARLHYLLTVDSPAVTGGTLAKPGDRFVSQGAGGRATTIGAAVDAAVVRHRRINSGETTGPSAGPPAVLRR